MTDSPDQSSTPEPVDYLDDRHGSPEPHGGAAHGRRLGVVGGVAVAAVAVAGAGAWGVAQLLGGGGSPAGAVPADALAYVALDLDPDAGQKLEALKTLRKFPALRDDLGLGSVDDLRSWLFDVVRDDAPCEGVTFADDVEPWLGDRVALSVVPGDAEPVPFVVLQVTDQDAAEAGASAWESCADTGSSGGSGGSGVAFTGDYMVVAETEALASRVVEDVADGALADDADYQRWVEEAGGAGILTGYVSADGPAALADAFAGSSGPTSDRLRGPATPFGPGVDLDLVDKQLQDFEGAAMVVRFADSSLEMEVASAGLGSVEMADAAAGGDGGLADLPDSTAVGFGVGVSDTAAHDLLDGIRGQLQDLPGQGGAQLDAMLSQLETASGLTLPGDLQALLGDGVAVAVDSSLDPAALEGGSFPDPTSLPVGIRIDGDPATIMPALDKLRDAVGPLADMVVTEAGDHAVALGLDPAYTATLAGNGGLGDLDAFAAALPDLSGSAGGLFVNLNAGDWLTALTEGDGDQATVRENLEPLQALGVTGRVTDGVSHARLRLTTD